MCMMSNNPGKSSIGEVLVFSLGIIPNRLCVSCKRLHKPQLDSRRI
jgi:hypothetical protein